MKAGLAEGNATTCSRECNWLEGDRSHCRHTAALNGRRLVSLLQHDGCPLFRVVIGN